MDYSLLIKYPNLDKWISILFDDSRMSVACKSLYIDRLIIIYIFKLNSYLKKKDGKHTVFGKIVEGTNILNCNDTINIYKKKFLS